jgi:hypothetical protein
MTQTVKILAPDGAAMDQFGAALALDGVRLAVGATDDDDRGFSSGSVYLFEHNPISATWQVITKLVPLDGMPLAYFGASLALKGNTLAVGAPGDDGEKGAVYLYQHDEETAHWASVLKIVSLEAEAGDNFGNAISLSGDWLAVGARNDDDKGFEAGAVYLYARDQGGLGNWGFVKKIFSTGTTLGDYFGTSVAIEGDILAVGAVGDDVIGAMGAGTVTVFERHWGGAENWGEVKILIASDPSPNAMLGMSVAVQGDTILAGAIGADAGGTDSGTAYVFARDFGGPHAWGEQARLIPTDSTTAQMLGQAVALTGDLALVGAPENSLIQPGKGAAYLFARHEGGPDLWGEFQKLTALDGDSMDAFGSAVAIQEGLILVGAKLEDENGNEAGAVYGFSGQFPATVTPTPTGTPTATSPPTPTSTATPEFWLFAPFVHR